MTDAEPDPFFSDHELARRLEATDAWVGVESARMYGHFHPSSGAVAEKIGGGYAVYNGVGSPFTQAIGLGMDGPVSQDEVERLEEFFHARGASVRIEFCPYADPSLTHLLGQRAYRVHECTNMLVKRTAGGDAPAPPLSPVVVQRCSPAEADLWARTVAKGFGGDVEVSEENVLVLSSLVSQPNTTSILAWVDGQEAGGGALSVHDRVGVFYGASTLARFRRRGVQSAVIHAILAEALQAECDLVYTLTVPGSASQRNAERQGFAVAYTRFAVVEPPRTPAGGDR